MSLKISRGGRNSVTRRLNKSGSPWQRLIIVALLLVVAILLLFWLLRSPLRQMAGNFFYPYMTLPRLTGAAVADNSRHLASRRELVAAVAELEARNRELALECAFYRRMADENRQLRALLKLRAATGFRYQAAGVIRRDPLAWQGRLTIDRGAADGINPGYAVMVDSVEGLPALLGIITATTRHSAEVMTVLDAEFRLSAAFEDSQVVGFLNVGTVPASRQLVAVGCLDGHKTYTLNETVSTTGFEPNVPGQILIGHLNSIDAGAEPFDTRLYRTAQIKPAARFDPLYAVWVAIPESAAAPQAAAEDSAQ